MTEKLSQQEVFEYWTKQANEFELSPSASWSDHRVIEMEIGEIVSRLQDGDHVLDVGCANGYSSVQFARTRKIRLKGIDYIPKMIEFARARSSTLLNELAGSIEFEVGDATALSEPAAAFDKVVVIRVLINLGTWDRQLQALRECARVVKPGGILMLSEATVQGWRRLNQLRSEWGLSDIPMPAFNQYLDIDQVVAAIPDQLRLLEIRDFASTYYVGTRLLKPLLAMATKAPVDIADPNAEWNRWLSQLPAAGDYGTQKLFVFQKL